MFVVSLASAQVVATTDTLKVLKENHQKAMQNFGQANLMNDAQFSYAVVGKKLVSVVKTKEALCLYTEDRGHKVYTVVSMARGEKTSEVAFTFANKLTMGNSTYDLSYIYTFDFGGVPGYRVKTVSTNRWDWDKCWECLECAANNFDALYTAYEECQLNWECWLEKYQQLIDLYNCVINSCVPCFEEGK
jgi:hypothetical protein